MVAARSSLILVSNVTITTNGFPAVMEVDRPGQPVIWPAVPFIVPADMLNCTSLVVDLPFLRTTGPPPTPGPVHLTVWDGAGPVGTYDHAESTALVTWTDHVMGTPLNTVTWLRFNQTLNLTSGAVYYLGMYVELVDYVPGLMDWAIAAGTTGDGIRWINTTNASAVFQESPISLAMQLWLECAAEEEEEATPVPTPTPLPSTPISTPTPPPPPLAIDPGAGLPLWLGIAFTVSLLLVPLAAIVYLVRRCRRETISYQ